MPAGTVRNLVSVSGGKDSTATYLHALECGETFEAVFADTGNEHPWTYDYVRSLAARTGGPEVREVKRDLGPEIARKRVYVADVWRAQGVPEDRVERALAVLQPTGVPYLDMVLWKGRFPSSQRQFCTEELKIKPICREVHAPLFSVGAEIVSWQGVRAEESPYRASLPILQTVNDLENNGRTYRVFRPLLDWAEADVFSYHARFGIEPNPLYAAGMNRVGCMPCINCGKLELREIANRFPEHIDRIAEWERLAGEASKRGRTTFFSYDKSPGPHLADHSIPSPGVRAVVSWSRTSRGGRQFDLLGSTPTLKDLATACDAWGACE